MSFFDVVYVLKKIRKKFLQELVLKKIKTSNKFPPQFDVKVGEINLAQYN
jgi:hypothetical protein